MRDRETEKTPSLARDGLSLSFFCLVIPRVVTAVVVIVVLAQIHLVEDDAKDLRIDFLEHLLCPPHHRARGFAAMDYQHHAINHRGDEHAVGKRSNGWRINDDLSELGGEELNQPFHLIRSD